MLADHRDGLSSSSFLAWSSIAQSVCQRAFSLLAIWCLGPRVQILHSAEEHNLSPFDLNIACLCQSLEINNNKYVYRQPDAKVNWQWGQVGWMLADHRDGLSSSSFLTWSSIARSVCQRAFSLLTIWCLGPRVQILHSAEEHNLSPFDLNIACLCQSIEINNNKYILMSHNLIIDEVLTLSIWCWVWVVHIIKLCLVYNMLVSRHGWYMIQSISSVCYTTHTQTRYILNRMKCGLKQAALPKLPACNIYYF